MVRRESKREAPTRGMGRVFRRDGFWHVDIQHGKIGIRQSTKIPVSQKDSKQAAQNILTGLLKEIQEGRFGQSINKVTPLSRAHVPQSVAMRRLGHKTASMFLRYDVAATDDLAAAVEAAERSTNGTTAVQERRAGAGPDESGIE